MAKGVVTNKKDPSSNAKVTSHGSSLLYCAACNQNRYLWHTSTGIQVQYKALWI